MSDVGWNIATETERLVGASAEDIRRALLRAWRDGFDISIEGGFRRAREAIEGLEADEAIDRAERGVREGR